MAINLGKIEKKNQKKNNYKNVSGLQISTEYVDVPIIPTTVKQTTNKPQATQNNDGYFKKSKGNGWQTFGYSALDALGNFTEGSLNFFEGMSDNARYAGANVLDWFGADKKAEEIRKRARENDTADIVKQWNHITAGDISGTKSEEEIGHFRKVEENSIFGEKSDQVIQGVGNSLTGAAVGSYLGAPITGASKGANFARNAIGLTSFGSSAAGHATTEAYNEGANDFQAGVYGILNGAVEAGSEMLFGGLGKINKSLGFGTGALDDVIVKKLTKNIGNTLVRNVATVGLKSAGEGVEEIASLLGDQLIRRMMNMDSKTIKELAEDGTLADTFVQGTLSSLISQTPSGISSTVQGRDYTTGLTRTQRQYVNEIAQQRMVEAQRRNAKLNGYEKGKIEDRALTDFQKGRLANASKLQKVNLPGLSNKDMDLQQSAYKYGINPNSEFVVTTKTMLDNRGIKSRFDADAFKNINGNAYWTNNNGVREVVFNPNASEQAILEEIAIHELTHDLMSSKNSKGIIENQNIIDYVKTLDGYKKSKAKLEKLYSTQTEGMSKKKATELINEEIIADTLGKNIGSQEYIRRLIDDEPSIAKNIYDWVVNKVANKNGVKNEKAYWNNVKNNFEKAYNMEYQGKGNKAENTEITKYGLTDIFKKDDYSKMKQKYQKELKQLDSESPQLYNRGNLNRFGDYYDGYYRKTGEGIRRSGSIERNGDGDIQTSARGVVRGNGGVFGEQRNERPNGSYTINRNEKKASFNAEELLRIKEEYSSQKEPVYTATITPNDFLKLTTNGETLLTIEKSMLKNDSFILDEEKLKQAEPIQLTIDPETNKVTTHEGRHRMLALRNEGIEQVDIVVTTISGSTKDIDTNNKGVSKLFGQFNSTGVEITDTTPITKGTSDSSFSNGETRYSLSEKTIQGLERYSTDDIKQLTKEYIQEKLYENDLYDVAINGIAIHGSRARGTARTGSDLDIVVEYEGDVREDTLFDILNEEPMYFNDIRVDINPITASKTGTLAEYMESSDAYDKEVLAKQTKYSLTDNQGRKLSEEQQEYFKDSKVRDSEGRLLEVYHNTDSDFTVFDANKYGKNTGEKLLGIYLSPEPLGNYGDKSIRAYANITNPVEPGMKNITEKQFKELLKGKVTESNIENAWRRFKNSDDLTILENILRQYRRNRNYENPQEFYNNVKDVLGYDGAIYGGNQYYANGRKSYVAFNSNQIKNVDNTNPTDDADIRYSLSVKEANTGTDNKGNKLSKGMQNYMKDSKATDENGNLIQVFHTTTDKGVQFNEFDPRGTDYYRFDDQVVNFYTDSKNMSGSYANGDYEQADTKKLNSIEEANEWLSKQNFLSGYDNQPFTIRLEEIDGKIAIVKDSDGIKTEFFYENIEEALKRVKKDAVNLGGLNTGLINKYQYAGYVNITNPYIVDADGQMWDSVKAGIDPKIIEQLNKITDEEKKALIQLANESVEKHKTLWDTETEDEWFRYRSKFKDLTNTEQHQVVYHRLGMELDNPDKEIHIEGWVGRKYIDRYETLETFANKYDELAEYYELYHNEISYFQTHYKNMLNTNKIENINSMELFDIAYRDFSEDYYASVFEKDFSTNDVVFEVLEKNKNGSNYDGVIIKNVVDYGGKSDTREPANLYITFASNQFKAVDNENPTDDADIRYSLSDTGKTGTLMAIHNLDEQKLKGILELGGFPVPSIAVTNPKLINHQGFGNISVLFDKSTIDPFNRKNEIYDRDVWSPTFPRVEYDINNADIKKYITNGLEYDHKNPIINQAVLHNMYQENLSDRLDRYGKDRLLEELKKDKDMKYFYKKTIEKGEYTEPTKRKNYSNKYSNESLQRFINSVGNLSGMELPDFYYHYLNYGDMKLTTDEETALKKTVRDAILPEIKEKAQAKNLDNKATEVYIDMMLQKFDASNWEWQDFIKDASNLYKNGEQSVLDIDETYKTIDDNINQKEYEKWIDSTFGKMFDNAKKGIRNDKDLFTPSGNRRSFNQLHEEYNLSNIVKLLTNKKSVGGQEGWGAGQNFGTLQAKMSNRFNSIEEIKQAEDRLQFNKDTKELVDGYSERIYGYMSDLREYNYNKGSSYYYGDNAGYALNDFAEYKTQNMANLKKALENNGINSNEVPNELLEAIVKDINELKYIPTDYFEAKPQRAVGLDEVQALVIPNTTSAEFKQQLQEAGLKYYEYDPNIEGDRQRVINQFEDLKFSKQNEGWQSFLDNNFESKGTKTRLSDIKLPGITNTVQEEVQTEVQKSLLPIANELKELNKNLNKVLNPNEISQLTPQDANTTPILPGINRNQVGDGRSSFFDNINNKVNMLNDEQKAAILSSNDVKYYDKVTNKDSLDKAYARLQENGQSESLRWFNKASESADATDVAEGWILLKHYADSGDTNGMVEVAKKLRDMGTKAGQTVQAFNILSRLTPEGMVKYAQSELLEAYDNMVKNKSAKWIEDNRSKFDLQPNEVQFIMDTMREVSTMEDGYDKKFKLAQIQKVLTDKLPPAKGAGMKAWMRISMLFNPKTQVRNVAGNALIAPINAFGDMFASGVDKLVSAKTGVRTTGNTNWKNYAQGMKTGLYQSYNDFKNGVNTRNIEGNRFEITEGKSFNDNNPIGKALNKVDSLLSFMLDAGDRGFYEASFVNSINNQMVLNNTTEVTQDMIDIATQEALSRTWQDNNEYTKFVMNVRNGLNKLNIGGYGLGDVLIPFAKTPANLTKAIVEYSPVGLIGTINKGIKLNRSLTNGQYSAKTQHEFVQSLGKATAGTMLYVLGLALANAGITSGESDEDKDVSNFMKNTLGVNSYSIKIGDMSFTYDWAQPLAAPLAITANLVQKQKEEASLLENVVSTLDTAGNLLLEQSFMESISTVLNNNEGIATGMQEAILDLPARAIPTFLKQITDLTDGTQRQTFVKDKPIESMFNSMKAKIPGLSYTLDPSVDTMGREIQKYGGKNNLFNVFLNPANVSTENVSESAQEIYRLYKETGETNIMPRVAPYYVNKKGEKIILTTQQRTQYQKVSGDIIEANIANLLGSTAYQNMSDTKKAETINDIVNYSYNIAQNQVLGTELSETYETAYGYAQIGDISDFYEFRNSIDDTNADTKRTSIVNYLYNSDLEDNQIANLYGNYYSSDKTLNAMLELRIPMREFIKFNSADIQGQYNTNTGQTISGSKKNATIEYVNTLNLSKAQRAILVKSVYSSYKNNDNDIVRYVNTLPGTANEKKVWLKSIGFDAYDDDVFNYINSQNISKEEKIKKLKELGFTVRDGRVYY